MKINGVFSYLKPTRIHHQPCSHIVYGDVNLQQREWKALSHSDNTVQKEPENLCKSDKLLDYASFASVVDRRVRNPD